MSAIDDYHSTLTDTERAELERVRGIAREMVPDLTEGISYAMPAYFYRGKPFLTVMVRKNFLSIYPFSGRVSGKLAEKLEKYERTPGSIHYQLDDPIPAALLKEIMQATLNEIDEKLKKK